MFATFVLLFLYGRKKYPRIKEKNLNFFEYLYPVGITLIRMLPENFFGSEEKYKEKYLTLYGEKDVTKIIRMKKIKLAIYFYVICLVFSFFLVIASIQQQMLIKQIVKIERPLHGHAIHNAQIVLEENNRTYAENVKIHVKEKKKTKQEINDAFDTTKMHCLEKIKGENNDLKHVYKPLNLYTKDPQTSVYIKWASNRPDLVDYRGNVFSQEIKEEEEIILTAELELGEVKEEFEINLTIVPFETSASLEDIIKMRIERVMRYLNDNDTGSYLILPKTIEGQKVKWYAPKKRSALLISIIMLIAVFILLSNKYSDVDKNIKRKKLEIERDFPDFISKLVLLLNAGLIVQIALEKISADYMKYNKIGDKRPLYEELTVALNNVNESNTTLVLELRNFAIRCKVKEIMRFVSIVNENIHMGSDLIDKLQSEADQTWRNRKNKAEELGRLAETKLTFPLVILLIVLITIIITPAMMEM